MRRRLTHGERDTIRARTAAIDARTGVHIVATVIDKADHYAELPWKAFALGAAAAALVVVGADRLRPDWSSAPALVDAVAILGAGAASALLAICVPAYARLFLTRLRGDAEARHDADSMFLHRHVFATTKRHAILVLVCLFERKVEIRADADLHDRVGEPQWRSVIARMTPALAAGRTAEALERGLGRLDEVLAEHEPGGAR
jgi:putative membrane protein